MRNTIRYIILFFGCLLVHYTPLAAEGTVKAAYSQTEQCLLESKGGQSELCEVPVMPSKPAAVEARSLNLMFGAFSSFRQDVRVPVRFTSFNLSLLNILLYSKLKDSLTLIYIQNFSSDNFRFSFSSCKYYVFALRKILV